MHPTVVIVGLGEVGKPLLEIMKGKYQTFGVDIDQPASVSQCDVMHICFPFQSDKFVRQVVEYIHQYRPALTVINSTVRSEEHTSELQSHHDLVCRLLLEKKKKKTRTLNKGHNRK